MTDKMPAEHWPRIVDENSHFAEIAGLRIHYKTWGMRDAEGANDLDVAYVLVHGFGASTFTWREVVGPLSERLPVLAFDRPAFGLTDRPLEWEGDDPYAPQTQANLTLQLMDRLGIRRALLVGHSAGAPVCALASAQHPDRVAGVVLEDPAIFNSGPPAALTPLFRTSPFRRVGPRIARRLGARVGEDFLRTTWYDADAITTEVVEGYMGLLRVEDWDHALWKLTIADRPKDLPKTVASLQVPTLVMTGDHDRIVPVKNTQRVARLVKQARLVTVAECGHVPHEEQPAAFVAAIADFTDEVLASR